MTTAPRRLTRFKSQTSLNLTLPHPHTHFQSVSQSVSQLAPPPQRTSVVRSFVCSNFRTFELQTFALCSLRFAVCVAFALAFALRCLCAAFALPLRFAFAFGVGRLGFLLVGVSLLVAVQCSGLHRGTAQYHLPCFSRRDDTRIHTSKQTRLWGALTAEATQWTLHGHREGRNGAYSRLGTASGGKWSWRQSG